MGAVYHENQLLFAGNLFDSGIDGGGGIEQVIIRNGEHGSSNGYLRSPPPFLSPQNTPILVEPCPPPAPVHRKRRRTKPQKNKEEIENQRMTHIAVERNRRRQMNDHLAVLRSLMPPSYSQRGDQASIVGGTINFTKEMEKIVHFLEAMKLARQVRPQDFNVFLSSFSFPQYTTSTNVTDCGEQQRSNIADIEVSMVETHANIKVVVLIRQPKLLIRLVTGFHSFGLHILHLNITAVDPSVLYSFSVKVEEYCPFSTVSEIAKGVHDMLLLFREDAQHP